MKEIKQAYFVILVLAAAILFAGCAAQTATSGSTGDQQTGQQTQPSDDTQLNTGQGQQITTYSVDITSSGFSPNTLTINAGDTVVFTNKDSSVHWPASAVHPTHSVYPESGGCIGSKFDACRGLAQGESFSFTFNQKGSWKYHDHLNPASTGTIVVE